MVGKALKAGTARFGWIVAAALVVVPARADSQPINLDGQTANGAESACDLNVVQTLPIKFESKVTNKALGDSFTFNWFSAGPGGFSSSVPAGSTGGVGAKWVWSSNQTVYAYTGSSCQDDICFGQTGGTDSAPGTCSAACLLDGTNVAITKGASAGVVVLTWTGGTGPFTVYRSTSKIGITDTPNAIGTTALFTMTDTPPAGSSVFYVVRGGDCATRKACMTNADCSVPGDGTCNNRGPFGVPGRSLSGTDVTVSATSLSSTLITFFSPPKTVFEIKNDALPGGTAETIKNPTSSPVTVTTEDYPPGCCPANADGDPQLRCDGTCVDYLNDPANCGACGNVCDEETCCVDGTCAPLCPAGQILCNGQCVDPQSDSGNCGGCDAACDDGTCCNGGACASICGGDSYCGDGECADLQNDNNDCGSCGEHCGSGTCCSAGGCASLCSAGRTWCGADCADLQNDSLNCGACGNVCGDGTCCNAGACVSVCAAGQVWCNGQCVDLQNDSANCGACGNACGDGSCCSNGSCASMCPAGQVVCDGHCVDLGSDTLNCGACGVACGAGTCCTAGTCASVCTDGRTYCDGLCYDTQNDPNNCGGCGIVCDAQSVCSSGSCHRCTGQGGAKDACDNRCVNLNTDPYNCGACGNSCQTGCPSHFHGVCSNGNSCSCQAGDPVPPPPSHIPPPTEPYCPTTQTYPTDAVCPNPHPTTPTNGACPNPSPSPGPVAGVCPNPNVEYGPVAGVCPNQDPSSPTPPVCSLSAVGSVVPPAPICVAVGTTITIPPGGSNTICRQGGVLFKEIPSTVTACGDTLPGPDGTCGGGISHVSTGTFMRLVPDTSKTVGDAYLTPYGAHITDTSGDGMLQPGESASLLIDVLNAGQVNVVAANAVLTAALADLTQDNVNNPVGVTVTAGSSGFGTIPGTQPTTDCTAPVLHPATNSLPFQVTVPADHPGDTSHPFTLAFTGTVNGTPFTMNVPISLGIADRCDATANTRDFDGLDGLSSPMAKLVPVGDAVPFPSKAFSAGNSRPMKLKVLCGSINLTDAGVDPPEIVGLSEATRGALDIHLLNLNADNGTNPNDPFFRFNNAVQGGQWNYNMRTSLLGTGTFTITIRIAGRKEYVTGFVLQ